MAGGAQLRFQMTGTAELNRDMNALADRLDNLAVMGDIAEQGAALARAFAPRRTGALIASIQARRSGNEAVVIAGSSRVTYAAVQNVRTRFMQRADRIISERAPGMLQAAVEQKIKGANLA